MIRIGKSAAPAAALILPPEAKGFMVYRLGQVISILEEIEVYSEPNTVAAGLVSKSIAFLGAAESIAQRDFKAQLESLVQQPGDSSCKLDL